MLFPSARNTWIAIATLALLCTPLWAGGQVIDSDETQTTTKVLVEAPPPGTQSSASVAIVVDHSAAAKGRTEQLKKAVSEFLKSFSTEHEACVYLAGERPTLVQDFTSDAEAISGALKRLKPRGKLAAYDTLAAAADHVRSDATNEKSTIVAFLAGDDDASGSSASEVEAKLRGTRNVALFAITLPGRSWESQSTLQELAVSSGGRALFPSKNAQLREASKHTAAIVFGTNAVQAANREDNRKPLSRYTSIVVRSIPLVANRNTVAARGGENVLLQHMLVARLQKAKLFPDVIDGGHLETAQVPVAPASTPGTRLELLATIVAYERGSRLSWQFLMSGGTRMKVQVVLRDAATQEPVLSLVQEGAAVSGLFSGGEEQVQSRALMNAAKGIVSQLRKAK